MATNKIQDSAPIVVTAPSGGCVSGTPYLVGTIFGVALTSVAVGEQVALDVEGVYELPKQAALAISQGDAVYWDDGASEVDKTATNTAIGFCTEAAGSSDTVVRVRLVPGAPSQDVNATTVDAAGAVMESDYDAQTVLVAVTDDTPAATTIADSQFVGRPAGGNLGAMTKAQALAVLNVEDGADVTDATNVSAAAQDLLGAAHLAVLTSDIGIPFVIRFDASAAAAVIAIFSGDCPHKLDIIDFAVLSTATNAGATAKLNDAAGGGGNDITDAVAGTPVNTLSRAASIIVGERQIAAGGDLSVVKNAAGDDVEVLITCVRVA